MKNRYHIRFGERRTTVCLDNTLSILMSLYLGVEPGSLDAHIELADVAHETGKPDLALTALLKAADIARRNGDKGRWADLADRAHQIAPSNTEGSIAAAEGSLFRRRPIEAIALLEPISEARPNDDSVSTLVCTAYLEAGEYNKAEP